jgi:small subunit ribosomal protein S2
LLTNFNTVNKRIQRLKELEVMDFADTAKSGLTKKELLILRREKDKLEKVLGGIRNMTRTPSALWVVDTNKEHLAITEAKKLGIPVIAILDTNCDPDDVTIGIPGNDDAIRAIEILTKVIADAVADGKIARHSSEDAEPLPEWELEALAAKAAEDAGSTTAEPVAEAAPAAAAPVEPVVESAPEPVTEAVTDAKVATPEAETKPEA